MKVLVGFEDVVKAGLATVKKAIWQPIRGQSDGTLNVHASATGGVVVVPSDDTPLVFKSLWIGGDGNVTVMFENGSTCDYPNVLGGSILPVAGIRVMAATTATLIRTMNW